MIRFLCSTEKEILHFIILEQAESQRRKDGEDVDFYRRTMSNGMTVVSHASPSVDEGSSTIYIRGSSFEYDNKITSVKFPSNFEALGYRDKIVFALQEWAYTGGFARCKNDAIYQDKPPIYNF